jgi:hypothetical protein
MYALTWYHDPWRLISTAVGALALGVPTSQDGIEASIKEQAGDSHPRYRCATPQEYVHKFALPPYVRRSAADQRLGAVTGTT